MLLRLHKRLAALPLLAVGEAQGWAARVAGASAARAAEWRDLEEAMPQSLNAEHRMAPQF